MFQRSEIYEDSRLYNKRDRKGKQPPPRLLKFARIVNRVSKRPAAIKRTALPSCKPLKWRVQMMAANGVRRGGKNRRRRSGVILAETRKKLEEALGDSRNDHIKIYRV